MQRDAKEYTILNAVTPQTITSSTDATPIVVTKTAHGLSTGDTVLIFGHTTNVAANGIRKVTVVTSSTFSLQDPYTGASIAGSGSGAGSSGWVMKAPKVLFVQDYKDCLLTVITASTATLTAKIAGSQGKLDEDRTLGEGDSPNFGATQSKTNPFTYINFVDYDTNNVTAGSTGFAVAGTDINQNVEVNINGLKWLSVVLTTWTAGSITIKAKLFNAI